MTSLEIQRALCGYWNACLWNPRKVTAVRNSVGVCGWDADLLIIHESGWADEVEIKVSVSDFRREFKTKAKKHRSLVEGVPKWRGGLALQPHIVRRFWFAVPEKIMHQVLPLVPEHAGLIVVHPGFWSGEPRKVIKAPNLKMSRQLTPEERRAAVESVYHRYWGAEHDAGFKRGLGAA